MDTLFTQLTLTDVHQDIVRNILSLRRSQDLFDDLTDDPAEWALAQKVEDDVKPPPYKSRTPIIQRPFEDVEWFNAITWPFKHWQSSRFSDGTYGVWYGSKSVKSTVYESAYHWYKGFLSDAGYEKSSVISERKVYWVACASALLDFRKVVDKHHELLHPSDYSFCQQVGARINHEGHPGFITPSVRCPSGENVVIFNPNVLSNPRHNCQLTYRLEDSQILVEKEQEVTWMNLDVDSFS